MSKDKCKNGCDMLPVTDGYCLYCIRHGLVGSIVGKRSNENKPKQKSKINNTSKKRKDEAKSGGQLKLFLSVWSDRDPESEISKRSLIDFHPGHSMFASMFAHILPKGKYPKFRLKKENIMLVHPEEHRLIDQGTDEQRKKYTEEYPNTNWDKFFERQNELKKQYLL